MQKQNLDPIYTFKYKAGNLNINADAFSPNPVVDHATKQEHLKEPPPRIMPMFTRKSNKK